MIQISCFEGEYARRRQTNAEGARLNFANMLEVCAKSTTVWQLIFRAVVIAVVQVPKIWVELSALQKSLFS